MARQPIRYPIGSISSCTMRAEDLIQTFASELEALARQPGIVSARRRKEHRKLVQEIKNRIESGPACEPSNVQANYPMEEYDYYASEDAGSDLEALFDALDEYSAPYFRFGAHPGDGSDYGWFLSEEWRREAEDNDIPIVSDASELPAKYRGEWFQVSDHGNVTLWVKTSRGMREIWSIV